MRHSRRASGLYAAEMELPRGARGFMPAFGAPFAAAIATPGGAANVLKSVPWVAQWKFNNDANDSIGSNNLSPSVSSPTFTTGKLGGATGATQLVLANSQYWTIADNAAMRTGQVDFFIAAWVYLDTTPSGITVIAERYNGGANLYEYLLYYTGTSGTDRFQFNIYSSDAGVYQTIAATTFGSPSAGNWYLIVAWRDMTARTINICVNNGTVDSIAEAVTMAATAQLTGFGAEVTHTRWYWDGRLDNVCFAKSAAGGGGVLTAAQRTAFYNAGNGTEVLT